MTIIDPVNICLCKNPPLHRVQQGARQTSFTVLFSWIYAKLRLEISDRLTEQKYIPEVKENFWDEIAVSTICLYQYVKSSRGHPDLFFWQLTLCEIILGINACFQLTSSSMSELFILVSFQRVAVVYIRITCKYLW